MNEHEKIRRYLWMSISTSAVRAGVSVLAAVEWADKALEAFDKTFPTLEDKKEEEDT